MSKTIDLSPMTRVEGHLDVKVTVDSDDGRQKVVDAQVAGASFRGFETILLGRDPRDATHYTQRVCGVCPISHGMASAEALENALGIAPTDNGRIIRNLVLGANFLQSHILHFYHLAALDFINTTGILDLSPWKPRFVTGDMVGGATAGTLVGHYVQALDMRRKAHRMGAIYGGRMPCTAVFVPGGATQRVSDASTNDFRALLSEIRAFINNVYIPDVQAVGAAFPEYARIGAGYGNLIAYGVFDLNASGTKKLLARSRYTNGSFGSVNVQEIKEYVSHSWYTSASGNVSPANGITVSQANKPGAYSWTKAPRYRDIPHEAGPLARMYVNGDYRNGISVLDRHVARALEAKKVADAMDGWLTQLVPGQPPVALASNIVNSTAIGLTEAPRGALGHWIGVDKGKLSRYQIVTPTAWNASPMDDMGQHGPIEQALIGTPVKDLNQPIEVMRVVHSFDPCLSCSVHMVRPGKAAQVVVRV